MGRDRGRRRRLRPVLAVLRQQPRSRSAPSPSTSSCPRGCPRPPTGGCSASTSSRTAAPAGTGGHRIPTIMRSRSTSRRSRLAQHTTRAASATASRSSTGTCPARTSRPPALFAEMERTVDFFEATIGPYPFGDEKVGVVETPHLGMEHQTINAYGNAYKAAPEGFDWLFQHEFSHEWFGNQLTNADWDDMWLHEGFGTYMQPLYARVAARANGVRRGDVQSSARQIANKYPIVVRPASDRRARSTTRQSGPGTDIYYKGELDAAHAARSDRRRGLLATRRGGWSTAAPIRARAISSPASARPTSSSRIGEPGSAPRPQLVLRRLSASGPAAAAGRSPGPAPR